MLVRNVISKNMLRQVASKQLNSPVNMIKSMSTFSFLKNTDDDFEVWPRSHANTILNVCPQGELMVVERLGKLHSIQRPGLFVSIPLMDHIRFRIDVSRSVVLV